MNSDADALGANGAFLTREVEQIFLSIPARRAYPDIEDHRVHNRSRSGHRTRLLKHARALARTGEHLDANSVVTALEGTGDTSDIRRWLDDERFIEQLNLLCFAARSAGT